MNKIKLKRYIAIDIYGDVYIYNCENIKDARECFKAENGDTLGLLK